MIKTYFIEELTIEDIDGMVERGEVFDLTSKAAILSSDECNTNRNSFWEFGDFMSRNIRKPITKRKEDS